MVPALAIASALKRAQPDARVCFIGTARGLTEDLVERAGFRRYVTSVQPFTRSPRGALAPLSLIPATARAGRILRTERADVVVGMGGYPSVPAIAAARLARIPSIIHEANAIPGLANELAARLTANIAVAFPVAARAFGSRAPRVVGMPLREQIVAFDRLALRAEAMEVLDLDPSRKTVLVFGGSLGAARLSSAAVELATAWASRVDRQLVIIAGSRSDDIAAATISVNPAVRVLRYLDRMELAYAAADVVVSRAGASSVAELAIVGVPAVLVPLPHARRREQHANADLLVRAGAAEVVEDVAATGARLDAIVSALLADDERRARMTSAARAVAMPAAAHDLARWIIEIAGSGTHA